MNRIDWRGGLSAAGILAAGILVAAVLGCVAVRAADPNALWRIVHDRCVVDQTQHGVPAPCAEVSLAGGWVVLKDRRGIAQFLLIPTARVTGIEDRAVLGPDAPNYFSAAWAARGRVEADLPHPVPRDALSLAINSPYGRSQNQLHIHIDCLRPDVRAALRKAAGGVGADWAKLPGGLRGHAYVARWLNEADLTANPFRLLADWPGVGPDGLRPWTIVVAAMPHGFILLADHADPKSGDGAEGEELQDHRCLLADEAAG